MSKKEEIEQSFDGKIEDIFYDHTWSLEFIERVLRPEHTELWDYVSVYYELTDEFCDRNIDWLNFYELVYSQTLSREFYMQHAHRIDWLANPVDREHLFNQIYEKK